MNLKNIKQTLKIDKIIAINTSSLFIIYFLNFIISLVTIPRLVENFGLSRWGEITFFQIIINYFIWITDWSFPQYTSKFISINENNPKKRDYYFKTTRTAQLILFFLSSVAVIIISLFFKEHKIIFLFSILIILGNFLQPYWYFNGREKIYESALFQLLNKLIFLFFVFICMGKDSPISIYFLYFGISNIVTGILCTLRIKIKFKENLNCLDFKEALIILRKSFLLFNSSILGNITTSIIPIFIGSLLNIDRLGIYNIADRIKNILIQVINPISHSLFPRMSKNYYKDKMNANQKFLKIILVTFIIGIFLILFINFNMYNVISFFSKENIEDINKVLKILMFSFLLNIIYEIFMNQYLIVNGLYKEIMQTKFIILIASILFGLPLIYNSGLYGAALTSIIYELIGLIYVIMLFIKTKNKKYILE